VYLKQQPEDLQCTMNDKYDPKLANQAKNNNHHADG
jgi:hypothetical protein